MNNGIKQSYIPVEEVWWIYNYLVTQFLTNEGKIVSTILEYGGIIKNKKDLHEKLKKNNVIISYPTLHSSIKNLLLKEILTKEIINKQPFLIINKKIIEEAKNYKERILMKI